MDGGVFVSGGRPYYEPSVSDCYEVAKWLKAEGRCHGFTNIDVKAACGKKNITACSGGELTKKGFAKNTGTAADNKRRLIYDLVDNPAYDFYVEDDLEEEEEEVIVQPISKTEAKLVPVQEKPVAQVVEKIVEVDVTRKKLEAERELLKEKLKILDAKYQATAKEFNETECELKVIERILK